MKMMMTSDSPDTTRLIGLSLGKLLKECPSVILLHGNLGAGKTTISQAIAEGFGLSDTVNSPTYTIMNVYGEGLLYHLDLYRLEDFDELTEIGFDEIANEETAMLIEWPEMVSDYPFTRKMDLTIRYTDTENAREIILETDDPDLMGRLDELGRE